MSPSSYCWYRPCEYEQQQQKQFACCSYQYFMFFVVVLHDLSTVPLSSKKSFNQHMVWHGCDTKSGCRAEAYFDRLWSPHRTETLRPTLETTCSTIKFVPEKKYRRKLTAGKNIWTLASHHFRPVSIVWRIKKGLRRNLKSNFDLSLRNIVFSDIRHLDIIVYTVLVFGFVFIFVTRFSNDWYSVISWRRGLYFGFVFIFVT